MSTPAVPVSVIVPTYNRVELVSEAIESVLAQTYSSFELIVVDDGSTDDTERMFSSRTDLRYLRQAHSGMPGHVRNRGLAEATGQLIAFLDSDDIWQPHKLERQVAAMAAGGTDVHHTRELWLRHGEPVSQRRQRHMRSGDLFAESLRKCVIGPSTVLLRRAVLDRVGSFRPDLDLAEDYELWLRVTARYSIDYLDEALTTKRSGHDGQLSERYGHIELFRLRALRDLLDGGWSLHGEQRDAAYTELARKCRVYAAGCAKRDRLAEAAQYHAIARQADASSGR